DGRDARRVPQIGEIPRELMVFVAGGRSLPSVSDASAPVVSVVIPTHNRPALMRRAATPVLEQGADVPLEVIVVFDRSDPDRTLESAAPGRTVRVMANQRTPGLAGSRNTGILAARGRLVAFLDDDDEWLPGKLGRQLSAMAA